MKIIEALLFAFSVNAFREIYKLYWKEVDWNRINDWKEYLNYSNSFFHKALSVLLVIYVAFAWLYCQIFYFYFPEIFNWGSWAQITIVCIAVTWIAINQRKIVAIVLWLTPRIFTS